MALLELVRFWAEQAHPLGAAIPVLPFKVTTAVHSPATPDLNLPAAAPPTVSFAAHPLTVNFMPPETTAGDVTAPVSEMLATCADEPEP